MNIKETPFALRRAHQRYLFMNSKHHKSDAFRRLAHTAYFLIYFLLVVTASSGMAT